MAAENPSTSLIDQAIRVATTSLRWCYRERGIISGNRLVYWSWDSFFAGMGAVRLGDTEVVTKNLALYLDFQREDGAIPKRIANPFYFLRFLGIRVPERSPYQKPTFWNSYYTAPSLAQNPLLIIGFHDYFQLTNDNQFTANYLPKLHKIIAYLQKFEDKNGLLQEGIGGGWAESVLKRGAISFTNMCYAHSLQCMASLCEARGEAVKAAYYINHFLRIKKEINRRLWCEDEQGGYYVDWLAGSANDHFATDGNLLAIIWGIASAEKAASIRKRISLLDLEDDIPIRLTYKKYDFWRIFILSRLAGIKDYHVGFCWTWLGCMDALAAAKMGDQAGASHILERISKVIVRDNTVHEIYNKGKAVRTAFYKSEHPWAWGSGLFLYACHEIGYSLKKNNTYE